MDVRFFANTGSRRGESGFEPALVALRDAGVAVSETRAFDDPERLIAAVEAAVEDGCRTIIVGGGDGTISSVVHALAETDSTLGLLPLGTGNQLARDLGIPSDIAEAAKVIAGGRSCAIDLARVNNEAFINVATLGLTTAIARNLDPTVKRLFGRFAYSLAVARALRTTKPFRARFRWMNQEEEVEAIQIVVGNGRFHAGGLVVAPDAQITDSSLDVYAVRTGPPKQLAAALLDLSLGRHNQSEWLFAFRAQEFMLEIDPRMPVTVDGEVTWFDQLSFSVKGAALRVFVPDRFRCPDDRVELSLG